MDMTVGVPQGSMLGRLLWDIMWDDVLRRTLKGDVTLIGFADDSALLIVV